MAKTPGKKPFAEFVFIDGEGEETNKPGAKVEQMLIRFASDAYEDQGVTLSALPAEIQVAAAWHGLKQKLSDFANASSRTKPDDDRYDETMALIERLQAGDWLKSREAAGPRISLVFEAVVQVMTDAGRDFDKDDIRETLKDADERKAALANPKVKLAYEQIKLARAQKRMAELQAAADADDSELPF